MYSLIAFVAVPIYAQDAVKPVQEQKINIGRNIIEQAMPSYMYSLKRLISEAKKNIRVVNDEIKKKRLFSRYKEREDISREYFEKGSALYKEGKLKEAKAEWNKVLEITRDPDMRDYIKESERRFEEERYARERVLKIKENVLKRDAAVIYNQAIRLYRVKRYEEAHEKFTEIQKVLPNYASTNYYIEQIPQQIAKEAQAEEEALEHQRELGLFTEELSQEDVVEIKGSKEVQAKIDSLYEKALILYSKEEFKEAEELFDKIRFLERKKITGEE